MNENPKRQITKIKSLLFFDFLNGIAMRFQQVKAENYLRSEVL